MSLTDIRGVPVSTTNRASLEKYERAADLFQSYFNDPLATIESALAEDPGFVMGHCMRAGADADGRRKAAQPELRRSVEAAEALASTANERERGHTAAARAWLDGDFPGRRDLYGAGAAGPSARPAGAAGRALGRLSPRASRACCATAWRACCRTGTPTMPGYGYVLGMQAFGLEENQRCTAGPRTRAATRSS